MNCQLCQKESDAYFGGRMPSGMRVQVETHLRVCKECAEAYSLEMFAGRVISVEKEQEPGHYLTARIMAHLENAREEAASSSELVVRILRPALITLSMAAAIFMGVVIGNIYRPAASPENIPVELALIDDAAIESIDIFSAD